MGSLCVAEVLFAGFLGSLCHSRALVDHSPGSMKITEVLVSSPLGSLCLSRALVYLTPGSMRLTEALFVLSESFRRVTLSLVTVSLYSPFPIQE